MRAEPQEKTVTRATRGKNANIPLPLAKKSERITAKTENVRVFWQSRKTKILRAFTT